MCGIAGIVNLQENRGPELSSHLRIMNSLLIHRGPDGEGYWTHKKSNLGFAHRRLKIIDLETGAQPMTDRFHNTICYNGEIYNYQELRKILNHYDFVTNSDTEVILAAYQEWGPDCLNHFRGMFAFALWDESTQTLFCARDRLGIKPFYYAQIKDTLYFASEVKALLPFLPEIKTQNEALQDYLTFQFCLGSKTLFEGVQQLLPAHYLTITREKQTLTKYWEVYYKPNREQPADFFEQTLSSYIHDSIRLHTRADVPLGAHISGGIDSSLIASIAAHYQSDQKPPLLGFNGKFSLGSEYDESPYAKILSSFSNISLHQVDISAQDFINSIEKVIYHLDYPTAGPGSFAQYQVAKLVSPHRKVVLGGQGGDEIFGGYARYLIAYYEQCIKAALNGTLDKENFPLSYESIIPNLNQLRNYQPLLQEFWKEGFSDPFEQRYFRLINRSFSLRNEIVWNPSYSPFSAYKDIFYGGNVNKESHFDCMTHFDLKTLLPALLHVEDRMSMAHGVESRVPFLDHPIVEFAATIPAPIKFQNGTLKSILLNTMRSQLPDAILHRKDKMGFPVPLNEWMKTELKDFVYDLFNSQKMKERPYFNQSEILKSLNTETKFGRKIWGLLSLELWHRQFHDKAAYFRKLLLSAQM